MFSVFFIFGVNEWRVRGCWSSKPDTSLERREEARARRTTCFAPTLQQISHIQIHRRSLNGIITHKKPSNLSLSACLCNLLWPLWPGGCLQWTCLQSSRRCLDQEWSPCGHNQFFESFFFFFCCCQEIWINQDAPQQHLIRLNCLHSQRAACGCTKNNRWT